MFSFRARIVVFFAALLSGIFFGLPLFAEQAANGEITHEMTLLVFQLGLIIVAARVGGSALEKCGFPRVLGEITAGMLIGPYCLGGLPLPGFPEGFFPAGQGIPVSLEIYGITTFASIILLFLVGLETDIDTFLNFSLAGSLVGIGGVVISFLVGNIATILLSRWIFGEILSFSDPAPLFMGLISTATSVGISANILSEQKKMGSPEGVTILSGAVIDDVLGIILLAVVLGVIRSGHVEWKNVVWIATRASAIWLGFTALGLLFSSRISEFLKRFKDGTVITVMSLAMALFLAGIFEKSGLAMIIGAYIMGLTLSKTDLTFLIQENLVIFYRFFIPVFFCVMGMMVNFREMLSIQIICFGLIFVVLAIAAKILGCGIPAMFADFNIHGALRIGLGMTPRGEVTMIIAGIALSSGLLSHDFFGVVVLMTFLTTLITPPLFSKLLESDRPVLKKNRNPRRDHREIVFRMPNPETAELILSKVLRAFEGEGFYIHRLSRPSTLYQIRKNQVFLSLHYSSEKLVFDCQNRDAAFIHTVFYEVSAELEKVMKNIQALSYREKIGKKIFDRENGRGTPEEKNKAPFHQYVLPEAIEVSLKGREKSRIVGELIELLVASGQLSSEMRDQAYRDVMERENTMSTGMQNGIALPHARTSAVKRMVCAVGLLKEGVDFDSLDKLPSQIFFLTLSPRQSSEPQLQFIANLSKMLMSREHRGRLLSARTQGEVFRFLETHL